MLTFFLVVLLAFKEMQALSPRVEIALYVVIGGCVLSMINAARKLAKKVKIRDEIGCMDRHQPDVVLRDDAIIYRGKIYKYECIRHIIEYHEILYMICKTNRGMPGEGISAYRDLLSQE